MGQQKQQATTSADRMAALRERNKAAGRKRVEFYVTDTEHGALRAKLKELRA